MIIAGELIAESPIYRGNSRKTLFTRDGDGTQRLVSLAGEISGTAQALMDAFIGRSKNSKNMGLINRLWERLYKSPFPDGLISKIDCKLRADYYPKNKLFDLRMGIKLDDDRWAIEAHKNYKIETLYRNSVFDFAMYVNDGMAQRDNNMVKLYFILDELKAGRFWFGAGKSKGLGRCKLKLNTKLEAPKQLPQINSQANHLCIQMTIDSQNPILIGWPWGKLDPDTPAFANVKGKFLIEGLSELPDTLSSRLSTSIGGSISDMNDWKKKFAESLPQAMIYALLDQPTSTQVKYILPKTSVNKLAKGKYPIAQKILDKLAPVLDKEYDSQEDSIAEINELLGKEASKIIKRVESLFENKTITGKSINKNNLQSITTSFGLLPDQLQSIESAGVDEAKLKPIISEICKKVLPRLYQGIDRQVKMLQSDLWVDTEITGRREHLQIKEMLLNGKITERDWDNFSKPPASIKETVWRQFKKEHENVRYKFMMNMQNLKKSIQNDKNYIEFLEVFRNQVRQELSQLNNIDFRSGGPDHEISKKYGKPYDNMFMRMMIWAPSQQKKGEWEIFIPGSTLKGAFRKRASMLLNTIMGDRRRGQFIIDRLFGKQGSTGLLFFSDAYLVNPKDINTKFCSLDGIRMDPATGTPVEEAKADFLFTYGSDLKFAFRLDLQDITEADSDSLAVFGYLLNDFGRGDIPIGSLKTSGFGWVKSSIDNIEWLTLSNRGIHQKFFGKLKSSGQSGLWSQTLIKGQEITTLIQSMQAEKLSQKETEAICPIPRAREGFISHSAFGGYCGHLNVIGEIVTPISICESGEPTFQKKIENSLVKGWDFFSFSAPEANSRSTEKNYAIPSKSLKGMIRHIYAITSNSTKETPDISRLNPTDSLFGWVGKRPNEAIMGRISIDFGKFTDTRLSWYKIPYPYGSWQFKNNQWQQIEKGSVQKIQVNNQWRIFPNVPLAPCVYQLNDDFQPDTPQAAYVHAMLPGVPFTFSIRFWNLEKEELQRLIWCIQLDNSMAHKIGNHRYLGLGTVRFQISPESHLIDWKARYEGRSDKTWQIPITVSEWINPKVLSNLSTLQQLLKC
ncbi:MAG: hypothetical protein HQK77_00765 [Desulfobacterales bacterium]|nr:hypothetical protein [Desulfobacterales bacterium]